MNPDGSVQTLLAQYFSLPAVASDFEARGRLCWSTEFPTPCLRQRAFSMRSSWLGAGAFKAGALTGIYWRSVFRSKSAPLTAGALHSLLHQSH